MVQPVTRWFDKFLKLVGEQAYNALSPDDFRELEDKIIKEIRGARKGKGDRRKA